MFLLLSSPINAMSSGVNAEDFTILILNSYHKGYAWTDNQNVGINNVLTEKYTKATIYTEYLDWKRFPDKSLLQSQYQILKYKYENAPIDLILTTDDMALSFAFTNRKEIFSNAPIAFSGISPLNAVGIIGNEKNVTGVYEKLHPADTIQLMRILQPKVEKIYVIHDTSESGESAATDLEDGFLELGIQDQIERVNLKNLTFDELLKCVPTLEIDSAIIMISYNRSVDGIVKTSEEFCEKLSKVSSVPIYTVDEYLIGHGAVGGAYISGVKQGEALGTIGLRILEGTPADIIPFSAQDTAITAVDENKMDQFKLSEKNLNKDVRILNHKFSFFDTYKKLVLSVLGVFFLLLLLIIVLEVNIQIRKRSQKTIMAQKSEIEAVYEELSASEEELRAQNKKLQLYQEDLKHRAYHDPLTNLPNRARLEAYVDETIQDTTNCRLVLYFIDIDKFKYINNSYGHEVGDQLLCMVARNLSELTPKLFISRIGGDEFVLVEKLEDKFANNFDSKYEKNDVDVCVEAIQKLMNKINVVRGQKIQMTASIGYSFYPEDGITFEELLVHADLAMYHAKKKGKLVPQRYQNLMTNELKRQSIFIDQLKQGLDRDEFVFYYQPQYQIETHQICGFEALIRWNSKSLGFKTPDEFIPLAESSGIIIPLGYHMLRKALQFIKKMKTQILVPFKVSINISVVQFMEAQFVAQVLSMIEEEAVPAEYLQLEITESIFIESYSLIIEKLNELKENKISISLDDFGTGYSSLTYLKKLPLSEIKIDKSFMDDIGFPKDTILLETILLLANKLNFLTVAEGVESEEQLNFLSAHHTNIVQGFYFSKPLPEEEIFKMLFK